MLKYYAAALLALISGIALFWSSLSFAVANAPAVLTDVKIQKGLSYGEKPWQKLDVYMPPDASENTPVIVFFYGGRWSSGEKEQYKFVALTLAGLGYKVVVPDYAKYPDVKFPAFVEDGARAVSWAYDHISKKVYVVGHSAGAHMGALIASDPAYLGALQKDRSAIVAFAGLAGPYAFEPDEPDLQDIFGPPERYPLMQVPTFIDGKQPPMLLLHGDEDKDVVLSNLTRLKDEIDDKGGIVETKIYPGFDHIKILAAFSWVWKDKASVAEDINTFFRKYE